MALDDFINKKKYLIDTIDMRDVLIRYGVKARGGRCKCPIIDHGRGDTSAKVFRNGVVCFTCNKSYNIFDIVMKFEYCDFSTAFKILGGDTEITDQQKAKIEENKRLRNLELQKEKDYWLELNHLCKTIRFCEKMLKQGQYYKHDNAMTFFDKRDIDIRHGMEDEIPKDFDQFVYKQYFKQLKCISVEEILLYFKSKKVAEYLKLNDIKIKKKPAEPQQLVKSMLSMQEKYGVEFLFCTPEESGAKVIELLMGKE